MSSNTKTKALLLLLVSLPKIGIVTAESWIEVTRFTGSGGIGSTSHFTVDHVDWRIRWEINPGNGSERTSFTVYVFHETELEDSEPWFEKIRHFGTEETTGILNIYNNRGSFYMVVLMRNVDNCTLIIEQNTESIPEFPSWVLLPSLLVATLAAIICKQRLLRKSAKN